jgi:5-methylthioadenosine/S-adenosylhomocysteine deaminase
VLPITEPLLEHACVAVADGRITFVGPASDAPAGRDEPLGDAILMPGLVNAHTHLELTAFRGLLEDLPFRDWIVSLQAAKEAVMTPDDFLDAARLGVAEGLLAGITTYADTCDSGAAIVAMREMGVRGIMYAETFGPAPEHLDRAMAQLRAKVERARPLASPLVRLGVSPHAPYTVSDDLFRAVAAYAGAESLPMAVHIAESDAELRLLRDAAGPFAEGLAKRNITVRPRAASPIALLDALGVLTQQPLLIHCVQIDERDVAAIARHDCPVAHCPISNAKLGHGVMPLVEMLAADVRVALGSDSMASNNRMDLLAESRAALLAQRARTRRHDALSASRILELATLGGADALGLAGEIGSLTPGKSADLVAFAAPPQLDPLYAPSDHLVHALSPHVLLATVAGRPLVRHGALVNPPFNLASRITALSTRLTSWRDQHVPS